MKKWELDKIALQRILADTERHLQESAELRHRIMNQKPKQFKSFCGLTFKGWSVEL